MTTIFMLPAPPPTSGPTGTDGQGRSGSPTGDFASVLDAASAPTATVLPFTRGGAGTAAAGSAADAAGSAADATGTAAADGSVVPSTSPAQPAVPGLGAGATGVTGAVVPVPTAAAAAETETAAVTGTAAAVAAGLPTTTTTTTVPTTAAGDARTDDGGLDEGGDPSVLADVVDLMAARAAHATPPGAAAPVDVPVTGLTTSGAATSGAAGPGAATPGAAALSAAGPGAAGASTATASTATEAGVGQVGAHGALPGATAAAADAAAPSGTTTWTAGDAPAPGVAVTDPGQSTPSTPASASQVDPSLSGVVGVRVPTQYSAPVTLPGAPVPAAPALGPQVAEQLRATVPGLRAAGVGQHILTLRVEPESIGPVRVIAHIGVDGVRVELLGGTEAARDALRQALPDLRRDLAGSGLTDLNLGPDGGDGGRGRDDAPARRPGSERPPAETREAVLPQPDAGGSDRSRSRLDLLV
jgi:flagellar hook-length control protein FliK